MRVCLLRETGLGMLMALVTACAGPGQVNSQTSPPSAAESVMPIIDSAELVSSPATESPMKIDLACLTGRDLRKELPSRHGMASIRDACAPELDAAIGGWNLGQIERDAVLSTFVAHHFAPYGSSVAVTYEKLMTEPALDCDNYAMLAGYLFRELQPAERLTYVGFDGGKIGNHAQAFVINGPSSVLLDPTVGIVAQIGFDDLLMAHKPAPSHVLVDSRAPEPTLMQFHATVLSAVLEGGYKPSDMLYYLKSIENMIAFSDHAGDFWKSEKYPMLLLHYPTPGADGLRRNLMGSR